MSPSVNVVAILVAEAGKAEELGALLAAMEAEPRRVRSHHHSAIVIIRGSETPITAKVM